MPTSLRSGATLSDPSSVPTLDKFLGPSKPKEPPKKKAKKDQDKKENDKKDDKTKTEKKKKVRHFAFFLIAYLAVRILPSFHLCKNATCADVLRMKEK